MARSRTCAGEAWRHRGVGATAARGLLGRPVTIASARTVTERLVDGTQVRVTIHPSALLRVRTESENAAYRGFVDGLRAAAALAGLFG